VQRWTKIIDDASIALPLSLYARACKISVAAQTPPTGDALSILIPTLDDDAADAQAPLDSWLEATVRAQIAGLLSSAGEASSPYDSTYLRWTDLDDETLYPDHALWTSVPAVVALIPVTLPAGATGATVRLCGTLQVQPDEASPGTVSLWAVWEDVPDVSLGEVTLAPGVDDVWMASVLAPRTPSIPVGGERVLTLQLWCVTRRGAAPYVTSGGWRGQGRALTRVTPIKIDALDAQLSGGQDLIVRPTNPSLQPYPERLAELANSPDWATGSEEYDQVYVYQDVDGGETQLTIDLYNLTGVRIDAIGVSVEVDPEPILTPRALHRAGVVVEGLAHAQLDDLIQYTQDAPQLLLARPRGDALTDGEEQVMRGWRCAWGAIVLPLSRDVGVKRLLDELVVIDRPYGWLDVQLRVIAVNPIAAEEVTAPVWGSLTVWRDGVPPDAATEALLTETTLRLDALAPLGPGRVLRDLARYYLPSTLAINGRSLFVAGSARPITTRRTDSGWRMGTLTLGELPLVQVISVSVPVTTAGDAGIARLTLSLDPRTSPTGPPDDRLWARHPETLVAVVGGSVTWRGR
jgi:hypothetical protein